MYKVFVFIFAYTMNCLADNTDIESRILYGSEVSISDYPYFATTEWCGAVILSEKWLITAAHCVHDPETVMRKLVYVGGEMKSNSLLVEYSSYYIYPDYEHDELEHDIALLRLKTPLKFTSKVQNIKLAEHNSANNNLISVGRGKDETGENSESLMQIDLVQLTFEQCMEAVPPKHRPVIRHVMERVGDAIICAMRPDNKPGVCNGDSGSPLVRDGSLVGITAFILNLDHGCVATNLGFYTNVTTYIPWIRAVTGLDI